jgi:hypothetical protein
MISSFVFNIIFEKIVKLLTNTKSSECPLFVQKYVTRYRKREKGQKQIYAKDFIRTISLWYV